MENQELSTDELSQVAGGTWKEPFTNCSYSGRTTFPKTDDTCIIRGETGPGNCPFGVPV